MELQIKITTMKASIAEPSTAPVESTVTQPAAQPVAESAEVTIDGTETAASNTIVVGNISPPAVTSQVITTNVVQPVATSNLTINANVVPIQAQVGVLSVTPIAMIPSLAVTPIGGIAGTVVGGIAGGIAIGGIAI